MFCYLVYVIGLSCFQNQKKDFLAQLAAISALSRNELDEVVEATVASKWTENFWKGGHDFV